MSRLFRSISSRTQFLSSLFIGSAVVLLFSFSRLSPEHAAYRAPAGDAAFHTAEAHHHLTLNGKELTYRSMAGYMAIKDRQQKPLANIFYTAYKVDNNNTPNRPITFVFNGGPGSASIWLHMGAFGPVRANTEKNTYSENPNSWLGFTDLVFIDPVGTGYSQPAEGVDEQRFHGYHEDIKSIAEFIRVYLVNNHREASPKFVAGESYGAVRAIGLTAYLQDSLQIKLAGLTLISPVLNYKLVSFRPGNDQPYSYYLPTYALAAQYHHRLPAALQQLTADQLIKKVTAFSNGSYVQGLKDGGQLASTLIDTLSYFTGLSKEVLQHTNGRITDGEFTKALLKQGNEVVGTFDSRVAGQVNGGDPSEAAIRGVFTRSFQKYVSEELGYENHMPYRATTAMADWNYGPGAANGYLDISLTLKQVMTKNPDLQIKVSSGYYDLATPVATIDYAIGHLGLSKELKQNISVDHYYEGHMIYLGNDANTHFKKASEQFYQQTTEKINRS
ncbi:MAG: alpha/beta hydrolase [Bacteroidota bacterium]